MADYQLLWADLLTGEVQGEVPAETATFSHVLNAPGACNLTIPLRPNKPGQVATLTESTFAPGRTSIFVARDSVLIWGGILWSVEADVEQNSLVANANGFHSYFRKRLLRADLTYAATEQVDIAVALLDYALAQPGGSVPVTTTTATASGVTRDRTFYDYERKNIGELVEQLAAVHNGFDFRYEPRWDGNALGVNFLTSYPKTGRTTSIVLELGSNVELLSLTNDGSNMANRADAVGGGQGPDTPIRTATDTALLSTVPLLEDVTSHTDVTEGATLQSYADARLDRGRRSIKIPTVRLAKNSIPGLGDYLIGDQVRVKGSYGYLSVDDRFRITGITVSVPSTGDEAVELTLAPIGAFSE
jgi:hypothetical protein